MTSLVGSFDSHSDGRLITIAYLMNSRIPWAMAPVHDPADYKGVTLTVVFIDHEPFGSHRFAQYFTFQASSFPAHSIILRPTRHDSRFSPPTKTILLQRSESVVRISTLSVVIPGFHATAGTDCREWILFYLTFTSAGVDSSTILAAQDASRE